MVNDTVLTIVQISCSKIEDSLSFARMLHRGGMLYPHRALVEWLPS